MVEIDSQAGRLTSGIVVDSVSEVIDIKDLDIWDTPAFGAALNTEYIPQMAQMGGE